MEFWKSGKIRIHNKSKPKLVKERYAEIGMDFDVFWGEMLMFFGRWKLVC